ncbi:MAG: hypothetical protein IIV85_05270 [Clostridia bacterium]|nr:hypothetical protein [Clostridia bacterium]
MATPACNILRRAWSSGAWDLRDHLPVFRAGFPQKIYDFPGTPFIQIDFGRINRLKIDAAILPAANAPLRYTCM